MVGVLYDILNMTRHNGWRTPAGGISIFPTIYKGRREVGGTVDILNLTRHRGWRTPAGEIEKIFIHLPDKVIVSRHVDI